MHIDHPTKPPSRVDEAFLAALAARFGAQCHTGQAVRDQHGQSEAHFAPMPPEAVVFARSTEDVVDLVNLCRVARVPIIAYGAGTSIEGHTLAVQGGVSVNLSAFARNLTDKRAVVVAGTGSLATNNTAGATYYAGVLTPRTIGLEASVKF
jgi:D-lactate dehydrogenase (cytochrome)